MSASNRRSPGRSILPPVKPPLSYFCGNAIQPPWRWLMMNASVDSRWASWVLKS